MIADIRREDFGWVRDLNLANERELSPLTLDGVAALVNAAAYARQMERGAFLIAFDQDGDYDSPNFLWFKTRYDAFLYVDRIAVAATHRRRGLAGALYDDLFAFAARRGEARILCEVNSDPPNPGSDAFHAARGFVAVGEARLEGRGKTVRYLAKET